MFKALAKFFFITAGILAFLGFFGISGESGSSSGSLMWLLAFPTLLLGLMSLGIAASQRSQEDNHYALFNREKEEEKRKNLEHIEALFLSGVLKEEERIMLKERLLK
jgi:hypothetical protein